MLVAQLCSTLWPHGLQPTRPLWPWNSPCKNIGMGSHSHPPGIFLTQGLNLGLLHCRQICYHLSHQGSLWSLKRWPNQTTHHFKNPLNFFTSAVTCTLIFSCGMHPLSTPQNSILPGKSGELSLLLWYRCYNSLYYPYHSLMFVCFHSGFVTFCLFLLPSPYPSLHCKLHKGR